MSWIKKSTNQIVWIIYLAILLEVFAYLASSFIPQLAQLFYSKDVLSEASYNEYISYRDPVLGWPRRNDDFDAHGFIPRVGQSFDNHCVSLYGDSFTYSAEVEAEFSWPNVASKLLNCDVLNFGVKGYGTYQSFLRYTENMRHDHAKLVVLNHLSENINRIKNQYRGLLIRGQTRGFKPIAVMENMTLKHTPIKKFKNYDDYHKSVADPGKDAFPYETYLPNGIANYELGFPYSISLAKALLSHYIVGSRLRKEPKYTFHYRNSSDVNLVYSIMKEFISKARANNQKALITIIPTHQDLKYYTARKKFPYSTLVNLLNKNGIEYLDFGDAMRNRDDFTDFHSWFHSHDSHPNELGYKIMAEEFVKYYQSKYAHLSP